MVQATIKRATPGRGQLEILLPPEFTYLQENPKAPWSGNIDEAKLQSVFYTNPLVQILFESFILTEKTISYEQLVSRGNTTSIVLEYYFAYISILKDGKSVSGNKEYEDDKYTIAQRIHSSHGKLRSGKSKRR